MRKILSGLIFAAVVCWSAVAFAQEVDDDTVNVGPRGTATQSSEGWSGNPMRAIDGNTDGQWGAGTTTHTNGSPSWWEVDLRDTYEIWSIWIWNRLDCCSERLVDFTVTVLDSERNVSLLVDIGDELVALGNELKMHLIGAGNAWDSLAKSAHDRDWLMLSAAVSPEEIPANLAAADVGLFPLPDSPQWRVASALKIREWAACGLPVVASDIESHRTLGERGWLRLLPANSPPDVWGEMILAVLAERAELGRKARRDAESEFSWEMATEALHERLLELAGA